MSLIIAENVDHLFGAEEVFKDVSFRLSEADRVGLVGPNGEGKTTLLRIAAGLLDPTGGRVHRRRGLRIGFLPQDTAASANATTHETVLDVFDELRRIENDLHLLAARLADDPDDADLLKQYSLRQAQFEARGGYDYEKRIEQVLTGLGFGREMWDRPLSQLSGGQRTRTYLAGLLLQEPDVLMLDEPTNHLDLDAVEWLEYWLRSFRGALIVVSHDRYFLDHVTTTTWEIASGTLETYRAAYSEFLVQRALRHKEQMRRWQAQQEYISKTREFIARHLAGQRTKQAQGRRTRLERFMRDEAIDRPKEHQSIHLSLSVDQRTGDRVLRTKDLVIGYDPAAPLLTVGPLEVCRGQRIAIVGPNGVGKTTLLRTLMGELQPLGGTVQLGANVSVGYLSQVHAELDPKMTALDAVLAADPNWTAERVRSLLGSLLLSGDDAFKPIGQLSGGQRSRVILAQLVVQSANVLLLDEPTNHLDIPSTEIVQNLLQNFTGTLLFVSHDRYLVQAAATHIWAIDGGSIRAIPGGWEEYLQWRNERRNTSDQTPAQAKEQRKVEYRQARKQANLMQRLKRRHDELETEIETTEHELKKLNEAITAAGETGDLARIEQLGREYQQKDAHLKALWDQWEQVSEELE